MNNSMLVLYEEHATIIKVIDAAKNATLLLEKNPGEYENYIRSLIHFFRTYADQYHHHKEEEILFPEMAKKNELLGGSILHEMLENHDDFRSMIREIENLLSKKEYGKAQAQLNIYTEALLNHIAAENEEVFPIAETLFNDTELENLKFRFVDTDQGLGIDLKTEMEDWTRQMDEHFHLRP